MPRRPDDARTARGTARLSREAIVAAGIALADREGLERLSMRRLAQELEVNPMSLYHHVRDKDALLDAMLDAVVAGIEPASGPASGSACGPAAEDGRAADGRAADGRSAGGWTAELRLLVLAARRAVLAHPWAARLLQQRDTPTPAALRHIDRVLGILRGGGCSMQLSHHALHLLGSRVLGFSQDLFDDSTRAGEEAAAPGPAAAAAQLAGWIADLPHVAELAAAASHDGGLGGCDDDGEFAFGLDLLLDGLERHRLAETR